MWVLTQREADDNIHAHSVGFSFLLTVRLLALRQRHGIGWGMANAREPGNRVHFQERKPSWLLWRSLRPSFLECRWKRVGDPSALACPKRLSANVRLRIDFEAETLIANFGSEAYAVARKRVEEASSEILAADWREVALTIARRDQKAVGSSPKTDLGSSWPF
jgi:hypothetical protein